MMNMHNDLLARPLQQGPRFAACNGYLVQLTTNVCIKLLHTLINDRFLCFECSFLGGRRHPRRFFQLCSGQNQKWSKEGTLVNQ